MHFIGATYAIGSPWCSPKVWGTLVRWWGCKGRGDSPESSALAPSGLEFEAKMLIVKI